MYRIALNAHLLSAQAGYRSAGIHGYIYNTLRFLPTAAPDWDFHVFVGEGTPPPETRLTVHRAAFSTTNPLRRIVWEQLLQPHQLNGFDLYHGMAFTAPLWLKSPSVVTIYDLSFLRFPAALSRARRLYLSAFTRQSCQKAARVIAISYSTAHDLSELLGVPPEKITIAVPGVGADFRPLPAEQVAAFRAAKGLPPRFILHLGTLEPRKNLPLLLRAYAALPAALRQAVHVVLAGGKGWDYEQVFATIADYQLEPSVHLAGYVAVDELPLWYNAAEVFAYPSIYEGWGLPVTEAMACGCPTLVSDVSSLPEAAGDTGRLLPQDDEQAWTDALLMALTDTAWQQASRTAGIARAATFTWQATAAATIAAYQAALE